MFRVTIRKILLATLLVAFGSCLFLKFDTLAGTFRYGVPVSRARVRVIGINDDKFLIQVDTTADVAPLSGTYVTESLESISLAMFSESLQRDDVDDDFTLKNIWRCRNRCDALVVQIGSSIVMAKKQ